MLTASAQKIQTPASRLNNDLYIRGVITPNGYGNTTKIFPVIPTAKCTGRRCGARYDQLQTIYQLYVVIVVSLIDDR